MTVIIKLKNIKCSVIKLDKNNKVYVDNRVKIEDSPWCRITNPPTRIACCHTENIRIL